MEMSRLCTREIVSIDAQASLRDAAALMGEEHIGALVVVTGDQPPQVAGIVTDRDLALEVLGKRHDEACADVRIGQLAKTPPIVIPSNATLGEAIMSMERSGVRRLLVVADDGGVVGLVSSDDLLEALSQEFESLARALRNGIIREKTERPVVSGPARTRLVYPAFGTVAVQ
ncbi:CBS domain-containing protein [Rhodoferax sediminis]|jgi:CBS domain-containing protein|nr:CBS domain-containing protein [Rhodoferax sediminis]